MLGKIVKIMLIITEHMTDREGQGKPMNIGGDTSRITPSSTGLDTWLQMLSEIGALIGPNIALNVVKKQSEYTDTMTIMQSQWKYDGSALPVTSHGMENTEKA